MNNMNYSNEDSQYKKNKEVENWGDDKKVEPIETIGVMIAFTLFVITVVFLLGFLQQ